jgi:hypothetical protein
MWQLDHLSDHEGKEEGSNRGHRLSSHSKNLPMLPAWKEDGTQAKQVPLI